MAGFFKTVVPDCVADQGFLARIPDPNSFSIQDPNLSRPGSASKNLSVLTQKIVSKLSENMIRVVYPGSGS
jgi:hypothetical protein